MSDPSSASPDFATCLERLGPEARRILGAASVAGEAAGHEVYLVGGAVRDLLLEREIGDLDLTVDGPAEEVAEALSRRLGGSVGRPSGFGTMAVEVPDWGTVDLATCRSERYGAPGALPTVERSGIGEDLARRDFTVNALAWRLAPVTPESRRWLDPHDGLRDLRAGVLRVLHEGSFVDDPTRILRGVQLAVRRSLRFEPDTARLARKALASGALDTLSGERLRSELLPTLALGAPAYDLLAELGGLQALHPALLPTASGRRRLQEALQAAEGLSRPCLEIGRPVPERTRVALAAVAAELDAPAREALARTLSLEGREASGLAGLGDRLGTVYARLSGEGCRPHEAAEALEVLSSEDLALLRARGGGSVERWLARYLGELSRLSLTLDGNDLMAVGVQPGPAVGALLLELRRARLDGELKAEDELEYARQRVASEGGA